MNTELIPQVVEMWCGVYVGALVVLAVMSYVSSVAILNGLEWLDRRLRSRLSKSGGNATGEGDAAVFKEPSDLG